MTLDIDGSNVFNETRNAIYLEYCEKCRLYDFNLTNVEILGSDAGYGIYTSMVKSNLTNVTARYRNYGIYLYSGATNQYFSGNNVSGNDFRDSATNGMYLREDFERGEDNYIHNNKDQNVDQYQSRKQ